MTGRMIGNLILMTTICVVIFWIFMALYTPAAHASCWFETASRINMMLVQ